MEKFVIDFKKFKEEKNIRGSAGVYVYVFKASAERYERFGNSAKFARVIGDKWIVVPTNTWRVFSTLNPHLAEALKAGGVDGYRVDNVGDAFGYGNSRVRGSWLITEDKAELVLKENDASLLNIYPAGYIACPTCGVRIDKDRLKWGRFCPDCWRNATESPARFFSYHEYRDGYDVSEKIDQAKVPVFGCEIERDYICSRYDCSENRERAIDDVCDILYAKNKEKRRAVFMSDGSLNGGGVEWITMPHSYGWFKKHKAEIDACLKAFKKHRFANSDACGTHIHINREFLNSPKQGEAAVAACKMAIMFNKDWEAWVAIAKREDTDYCSKPSLTASDNWFEVARKYEDTKTNHSIAINSQHSKTIECRLWRGIDDADELLLFLDLTRALAMFCKNRTLERVQHSNIIDVLKHLKDSEHLLMVNERLKEGGITRYAHDIGRLIVSKKKKGGIK